MPSTFKARGKRPPRETVPWGQIPPTLRVLYITGRGRTGGWLAEAFAADSAAEILLEQVVGTAAGVARLRDDAFDAVLVSHEPGELDALALVEGYRAGGADEPIVVLGTESEQEMAVPCYEVGADGYVCANTTTTRNLIWVVVRAVQRHQLIRESQRLNLAERQRQQREHEEVQRLLAEQHAVLDKLARGALDETHPPPAPAGGRQADLPAELVDHYREMMRTQVMMGSGNLTAELASLAGVLAAASLTAEKTLELHVRALEELLGGLGARSTRHVMTRADLLALELLVHLAESYRRRHHALLHPPRQQLLPGF